ncbi:MAG: amidohydrolase [Treponema sp.]|jgi:amidohydrolase|nr:amidohydrolase [Treponema sp.]
MDGDNLDRAVRLRHELHQHPELACRERWTKGHLINFLKTNTALEIVDRGRWFYALYRAGAERPKIAFRADFDALPMDETIKLPYGSQCPGFAHKCGHDGHSAALAGFALEINRKGADKNIYFVFQHGEETGQGAAECAPLMDEEGIPEIFAFHNAPGLPRHAVSLKDGIACCASTGMIIRLKGVPCHASRPEDGRNPAFAFAELVLGIPGLTAPGEYRGLVMATVIRVDLGEEAFGMSAAAGRLMLTVRGEYDDELERVIRRLEEKVREEAKRYGLEWDIGFCDTFPATVSHRESTAKVRRAAKELGLTLLEADKPSRGSEDFGWFTRRTGGAYFSVGCGENHPAIHTAEYDFDDGIVPTVADIYMALVRA